MSGKLKLNCIQSACTCILGAGPRVVKIGQNVGSMFLHPWVVLTCTCICILPYLKP